MWRPEGKLIVGDIVSRDGTDEHLVFEESDGLVVGVICVKRPDSGWTEVGDIERNLDRRYELVCRARYDREEVTAK